MLFTALGEAPGWAQVLQGVYDLVPIVLFLVGAIILQKTLYNKMVKGCYALFAGGTIMVFAAGVLKAFHKIVLGFGVDYIVLNYQFATTEGIGFLLAFLGLIGMFTIHNKNYTKVQSIGALAIPGAAILAASTFDSTMPFIVVMILGAAGFLGVLIYIAVRLKSVPAIILFSVAIVAMIMMGYLSTKTKGDQGFEWAFVQITTNIVYQACFLVGTILLKRKGLGNEDALAKVVSE